MSADRLMGYNPEIRTWLEARKPQARFFNQLTIEAARAVYREHGLSGDDLAQDLVDARDAGGIDLLTGRTLVSLPANIQQIAVQINRIQSERHPNSDAAREYRRGFIRPYAYYSIREPGRRFERAPRV